jgi:PilZ domain
MKPESEPGAGCAAGPAEERRKEIRYPIDALVIVRRTGGQTVRLRAVDISASGMRLNFGSEPSPLALDEEVTVEIEREAEPGQPPWNWGLGRVAYIGDGCAGIQLFGGRF